MSNNRKNSLECFILGVMVAILVFLMYHFVDTTFLQGRGDTSPESRTARAKVEEIDNLIEQEYLFDTDGDDLSQECMQALWTDLGISIPAIIQRKSMRPCSRAMRTLRRHRRRDDAG